MLAGYSIFVSFDSRIDLKAALNLTVFLFFPGIRLPLEVHCVHPNMGNFSLQSARVFQGGGVL